jgi:hypothetical protein
MNSKTQHASYGNPSDRAEHRVIPDLDLLTSDLLHFGIDQLVASTAIALTMAINSFI